MIFINLLIMLFAYGPTPGYSPKTKVLELMPTAICRKKYSICDLVGYIVYPTKEDANNETNGIAGAGSATASWDLSYSKILNYPERYKDWMIKEDDDIGAIE